MSVSQPGELSLGEEDVFVAWADSCGLRAKKGQPEKIDLDEIKTTYTPRVIVAQVGQTLRVRNQDKIKHNSFALKVLEFDSGLQKPGSDYEVKLSKPGLTKVFCRIHPSMVSDVLVLNNLCFKRVSGAGLGEISVPGASRGKGKIWLWGSRLKGFHSAPSDSSGRAKISLEKADFVEKVSKPKEAEDDRGFSY